MLAYAAGRRTIGSRQSNPSALLVIISVHVALLAIVMSARMERERLRPEPPITVETIHDPLIEPKPLPQPHPQQPQPTPLSTPHPDVSLPPLQPPPVSANPSLPDPGVALGGTGVTVTPTSPTDRHDPHPPRPPPAHPAVRAQAALPCRQAAERRGSGADASAHHQRAGTGDRCAAGRSGRPFIPRSGTSPPDGALAVPPATEDGRAIATTTVITLRFMLDS